ncbi:MAG: hypothetical protein ACLFUZ_04350, partial [Candidatus Micrarchaeia archaeon]
MKKKAILDDFEEEIESEFPFVGNWEHSPKKAKYIDDEGNEVKGQTILDRKILKKNVRKLVEASVDNLLEEVSKMKEAAEGGQTAWVSSLGLGIEGAEEFNGSVAKALVENLPEKLRGNVKVEAETKTTEWEGEKEEYYTGNVELTWVGKVGSKEVEISLFTGEPVGS